MINFPANPVDGQPYSYENRSWEYRASKQAWVLVGVPTVDAVRAEQAAATAQAAANLAANITQTLGELDSTAAASAASAAASAAAAQAAAAENVLDKPLAGLVTNVKQVITHSDTVLTGIGKLQAQLTGLTNGADGTIVTKDVNGNVQGLTKAMVGLANAENIAPVDYPVSAAQRAAIDAVQALINSISARVSVLEGGTTPVTPVDPPPPPPPPAGSIGLGNTVFFGDSLTKGDTISATKYYSTVDSTRTKLLEANFTLSIVGTSPYGTSMPGNWPIVAQGGWTLASMATQINAVQALNPQTVILHIGQNDASSMTANAASATTTFLNSINSMLNASTATGTKRIIVVGARTASWLNGDQAAVLTAMKGAMSTFCSAASSNRLYINLDSGSIPATSTVDGTHYSDAGANLVSAYIATQINNWARGITPPVVSPTVQTVTAVGQELVTSNGDRWVITSSRGVNVNGSAAGGATDVELLSLYNDTIYAKNQSTGNWWRWTGTAWTGLGTTSPLPTTPVGPSTPAPAILPVISGGYNVTSVEYKRLYGPGVMVCDGLWNMDAKRANGYDYCVALRFIAEASGNVSGVRLYWSDGAGYAGGNGGALTLNLVGETSGGLPDVGNVFSTGSRTPGNLSMANGVYGTQSNRFNLQSLNSLKPVVQGAVYYLLVWNTASDPVTNWSSVDCMYGLAGNNNPQRFLSNRSWGCLLGRRSAGSSGAFNFGWVDSTTQTADWTNNGRGANQSGIVVPIAQYYLSSGESFGFSPMETGNVDAYAWKNGSGAPIRERFRPSVQRKVTGFSVQTAKTSGSGGLNWALKQGSTVIDSGTISDPGNNYTLSPDISPRNGAFVWYDRAFGSTRTLNTNTDYDLEFTPAGTSVWVFASQRNGSDYGFSMPAAFTESVAWHFYNGVWIRAYHWNHATDAGGSNWRVVLYQEASSSGSGTTPVTPTEPTSPSGYTVASLANLAVTQMQTATVPQSKLIIKGAGVYIGGSNSQGYVASGKGQVYIDKGTSFTNLVPWLWTFKNQDDTSSNTVAQFRSMQTWILVNGVWRMLNLSRPAGAEETAGSTWGSGTAAAQTFLDNDAVNGISQVTYRSGRQYELWPASFYVGLGSYALSSVTAMATLIWVRLVGTDRANASIITRLGLDCYRGSTYVFGPMACNWGKVPTDGNWHPVMMVTVSPQNNGTGSAAPPAWNNGSWGAVTPHSLYPDTIRDSDYRLNPVPWVFPS